MYMILDSKLQIIHDNADIKSRWEFFMEKNMVMGNINAQTTEEVLEDHDFAGLRQNAFVPNGFLERAQVPLRFPQFRNSAALAHLAHKARGPRYVLVGGKAWYDPADIAAWLESNKRFGPVRNTLSSKPTPARSLAGERSIKRGRPTKFEQMKRRSGADA